MVATVTIGSAPRFQPLQIGRFRREQGETIQRTIEQLGGAVTNFLTQVGEQKTNADKFKFVKDSALKGIENASQKITNPEQQKNFQSAFTDLVNKISKPKDAKSFAAALKSITTISNEARGTINAINRRNSINTAVPAPGGAPAPAGQTPEEPISRFQTQPVEPPPGQAIGPPGQVPPQAPGQQEDGQMGLAGRVAFDDLDFNLIGPGFSQELFDADGANIEKWQRSNISSLALEYEDSAEGDPDAEGFRRFVSAFAEETGQTAILNEEIINDVGKQFEGRGDIEGRELRGRLAKEANLSREKAARITAGRKESREDVVDIAGSKKRFDKMFLEGQKDLRGVNREISSEDVIDALLMDPKDRKTVLGNRATRLNTGESKSVISVVGNALLIRGENTGEVITGAQAQTAAEDLLDGTADNEATTNLINKLRPDQIQNLIQRFGRFSPKSAEALQKIVDQGAQTPAPQVPEPPPTPEPAPPPPAPEAAPAPGPAVPVAPQAPEAPVPLPSALQPGTPPGRMTPERRQKLRRELGLPLN